METITKFDEIMEMLPGLDCAACGYKTCSDFAKVVEHDEKELKKCIHITEKIKTDKPNHGSCLGCAVEGMAEKMGWKDSLKRDFNFVLL